MALKKERPEDLEKADCLLLMPDYLSFLLTGKKASEYTNATTTQLVNAAEKEWDFELIEKLGFPKRIFCPLSVPGISLGTLRPEVREEVGFDLTVILPGTHDTASAVLAAPGGDDRIYLSSGTWSLMGVERFTPDCREESRKRNYTNEGGYGYRYRFLKNIMGLWMLQSVRKEWNRAYDFAELARLAEENRFFPSSVEVNDHRFLAPESMVDAIRSYCADTNQTVPETPGEIVAVIYRSLSESYAETVRELEELTGKTYLEIQIVGGGCQDDYLNRLTAEKTGKTVYAGPVEATAIGNLTAQMLTDGVFASAEEAKEAIIHSFKTKKYKGEA